MRSPSKLTLWACLLAAALGTAAPITQGAEITDRDVLAAVRKGVDYLLSEAKDGHWQNQSLQEKREFMGQTALGLYALLQAGHALDDPRLKPNSPQLAPFIKYVTDTKPQYTYDASLKAVALSTLPLRLRGPEQKAALEECRDYLSKIVNLRQEGGYPYRLEQVRGEPAYWDHSNSQYAVLGMWAVSDIGLDVPARYWTLVDKHWRSQQNPDGGWGYAKAGASTRSMTAAGLATLYITMDHVVPEAGGGAIRNDPALENAARFLANNLIFDNDLYYLHCLERVGLATGLRYFDKTDWYRTASANVLKWQQDNGSWYSSFVAGDDRVVSTAYALLFLTRGRSPVIVNKLQYETNGKDVAAWNARPRDDTNLTRYLSNQFEAPLNWQIINTRTPVEEWIEAPILLISGHGNWQPTSDELAKLRSFIESGGIIFSTTDDGGEGFTSAVRKYAKQLVDGKYEMRPLPKDHPILTLNGPLSQAPLVLGLSNGVRELWLHSPSDMGGIWHRKDISKASTWQFSANLCLYATGKVVPRSQLQGLAVPTATVPLSRTAKLVRLRYKGNWDPEPGAWPRLAKLAAEYDTQLQINVVEASKLALANGKLAHLTGTEAITLDEMETGKLHIYLKSGGTLLLESAGGNASSVASIKTLALNLYPQAQWEPIPLSDPLFGDGTPGAVKITKLSYRRYPNIRPDAAEKSGLLGIRQDDRWIVLFSADDITCGLLGSETWGIQGYSPESAQSLGRNLVVHTATSAEDR